MERRDFGAVDRSFPVWNVDARQIRRFRKRAERKKRCVHAREVLTGNELGHMYA